MFGLPRILHTLRKRKSPPPLGTPTPQIPPSCVGSVASRRASSPASAASFFSGAPASASTTISAALAPTSRRQVAASCRAASRPSLQSSYCALAPSPSPSPMPPQPRNENTSDANGPDFVHSGVPVTSHDLLDGSRTLECTSPHTPSQRLAQGTPTSGPGHSTATTALVTSESGDGTLAQETGALKDPVQQQSLHILLRPQLEDEVESEPKHEPNTISNQSLPFVHHKPETPKRVRQKMSITFFGPPPSPGLQWGDLGLAALSWLAFGEGGQSESNLTEGNGDGFRPVSEPAHTVVAFHAPNSLERGDEDSVRLPSTTEIGGLGLFSASSQIPRDEAPSFFRNQVRGAHKRHLTLSADVSHAARASAIVTPCSPFPRGHRRYKSTPIEVSFGTELSCPRHQSAPLGENPAYTYRRRRSMPGAHTRDESQVAADSVACYPISDGPVLLVVATYPLVSLPMTAPINVTPARIRLAFGLYITVKRRSPLTLYEEALK